MNRGAVIGAAVAVVGGLAGAGGLAWWAFRPGPRPPDVVLVVMDTVRADHLHACGHDKPNTPVLDRLATEPGWSHACDVVSPAAWTIPSHLAFFTGKAPLDLDEAGLEAPVETLAQRFQARGYDTALLSANMVLRKDDRFRAGFRLFRTARGFSELKGPKFQDALEDTLRQLDPKKPAFLVLNLVDAHAPYAPIPKGVEWAPAQRGIQHRRFTTDESSPFYRFMHGKMDPVEAEAYQQRLENGYDYGISLGDANVGGILDQLASRGRLDRYRIVVTSDHGELLGEHAVIGHGDTLYEPGMRVPLFYADSDRTEPLEIPPLSSGTQVFSLLDAGALAPAVPAFATNYHYQGESAWNGVAWWSGDGGKLVWKDGESFRFDLAADPAEANPLPLGDHPDRPAFEALLDRNAKILERGPEFDDETRKMLEQAGYLEPEAGN